MCNARMDLLVHAALKVLLLELAMSSIFSVCLFLVLRVSWLSLLITRSKAYTLAP